MFMYDPATFGTPLAMLQIPPGAIASVQSKAMDPNIVLTHYAQDCKNLQSLKAELSTTDASCVRANMVDVGYICKQCHMVYPGREACIGHQAHVCYRGKNAAETKTAILKLEQLQYDCAACRQPFSTTAEFLQHVSSEQHKQKAHKYLAQKAAARAGSASPAPNLVTKTSTPSATLSLTPIPTPNLLSTLSNTAEINSSEEQVQPTNIEPEVTPVTIAPLPEGQDN